MFPVRCKCELQIVEYVSQLKDSGLVIYESLLALRTTLTCHRDDGERLIIRQLRNLYESRYCISNKRLRDIARRLSYHFLQPVVIRADMQRSRAQQK